MQTITHAAALCQIATAYRLKDTVCLPVVDYGYAYGNVPVLHAWMQDIKGRIMKCYRIPKDQLTAFVMEIKAATTMDNIRKAFAQQPDGTANFYAETQAEKDVCAKFGKINDQFHNGGR